MTLDERLTSGLHRVADTVAAPAVELSAIRSKARANQRRTVAIGSVAGAAAVAVAVGVAGAALSGGEQAVRPAKNPAVSDSPPTSEEWTPERTRAEGAPIDFLAHRSGPSSSGLDAQLYCVGEAIPTGSPCDRYHPYDPNEEQHWAIEVTQGPRSAVFDVRGTPLVKDFDADTLLVQDGADQQARIRLLQADGTATQLQLVSDRAPARPGPDVTLIQDLGVYRSGMVGGEGTGEFPYLVDSGAGTLQLLDVPEDVEWWGPNVDEFLWGGDDCRAIWQQPDGTFASHDVDCGEADQYTDPRWNWNGSTDWLERGRMVLVEWRNNGSPRVVHASLDWGVSWQRIEVEDRDWGDSVAEINDALADALQQLR